jgi:hypothetical protein
MKLSDEKVLLQLTVDEKPDSSCRRSSGTIVSVVVGAIHRSMSVQDYPRAFGSVLRIGRFLGNNNFIIETFNHKQHKNVELFSKFSCTQSE